jgi:hypothetical protein
MEIEPHSPVIATTYTGMLNAADLAASQKAILSAVQDIDSKRVYCVLDVRNAKMNASEMMKNIQEFMVIYRQYRPPVGMKVTPIFVGISPIVKTFVKFMSMPVMGQFNARVFNEMDEAMTFIGAEMAA